MSEMKQKVIAGHVENNIILLDEDVQLPDGLKVTIIVPNNETQESSGLCGIWQDDRPVEEIVQEIISSR
jgi:hypothetical protein